MKILIADDHTLFRDALVQYIKRAEPASVITVCKDLQCAQSCLNESSDYDLVLLDFRMPGMNGLDGLSSVVRQYPTIRVALMSGVAEEADVKEAINRGAVAFFPKTLSGKAFLSAIQIVLTGEKYVPVNQGTEDIMPSYYGDPELPLSNTPKALSEKNLDVRLTPREKDVLEHLLKGSANKEIANALGLQIVTVKLHVRGICRKLDAKNRTHAAIIAGEMGFGNDTL